MSVCGGGGAAIGICILLQPLFLPYDHAEVMWILHTFLCVCVIEVLMPSTFKISFYTDPRGLKTSALQKHRSL